MAIYFRFKPDIDLKPSEDRLSQVFYLFIICFQPREYFPTWPAKSELNAIRARSGVTMASPEAPTGATAFQNLGKDQF